MAVLLDSWLAELVVVVSAAALALYAWMSRCQRHWQRKGAPYVEPEVPFGNFRPVAMGQKSLGLFLQDIYNMAPGARYVGFYGFNRPMLLIRDPELIRDVLIKDFGTFHDRGIFFDEEEPLNRHLFALTGIKWRQLRIKLSPAFTSGKLKGMFKTLVDCGHEMAAVLEGAAGRGETVEVRELLARYSTDFIASVGFGIEVHCQRDPDNEFRRWGRKIFEPSLITGLAIMLSIISPKLTRFIQVGDKRAAAVCKYFRDMVAHTVAYREKNNITRKDFMDLLIQLKNRGYLDGEKIDNGDSTSKEVSQMEFTMDDVAAQAFIFFGAGFETSSSTMSFALHELAFNLHIQTKLQEEIDSILKENGGEISYEALSKMSYLDKVVSETLRKYPPVPLLNREPNKEYKIPDSDVVLEKGTPLSISVLGLHRDPKYYPDPEHFDPERFSEQQKAQRQPYVYLPFGDGPRNCIGMRLGLLQVKVGLVCLLSKYNVRPTEKTRETLEYNARTVILLPNGGIQLRLEKRCS
ncbi:cytochrome P450 6k1-like [Schistocerca piceifrons]|uniref:cytochrome P450 6k1-like n=1 Tax=Schistocerca piceifrons TaxID=274613 RepID=UPI001F5FB903|nr:cytochrome P450 6k1-like [Schistocerca piceifrons]